MNETITIGLPRNLKRRLDGLAQSSGMNRSDVVREALRRYVNRKEFRQLRLEMVPEAGSQGICTDEDVFGCVS